MVKRVDKGNQSSAREKTETFKEKWTRRGKKFLGIFAFTENGKPKSSLLIYTFCLSFVFVVLLIVAFWFLSEAQNAYLTALPVFWTNLAVSLGMSAFCMLTGYIMHHFMKDKRLLFVTYVWLAVYDVVTIIAQAIMLASEPGGFGIFMTFFVWVAIIPVICGLFFFYWLFKRDYKPPVEPGPTDPVAETMNKYVNHR